MHTSHLLGEASAGRKLEQKSKEGAILAQTKGGDNSWKLRQDCFKCGKRGNIARECPEIERKQEQMHANIGVEAETEGEDLNKGENIFVQIKKEE
jgi:hypothetical protein